MTAVDTSALTTALERRTEPVERQTLESQLKQMEPQIARALPAAFGDADRFLRLVRTETLRVPGLLDCDVGSLLGAMMLAAQVGLEPGPLGHVYFAPFRNKQGKRQATFILGYKGIIELARRSGQLKDIEAHVVYEHEYFKHRNGTRKFLDHERMTSVADRGPAVEYYACANFTGGGCAFEILDNEKIEAHRKRSPARENGPWVTDFEAMARKTCVRVLAPYLPLTVQAGRALEADESVVPTIDAEPEWIEEVEA